MAALDPTEAPEADEEGNVPEVPRATLRLVKRAFPGLDDEDEDDEIDDEYMKALLAASDDEDDEDEEEANGGPSDPAKVKKQKQAAAIKKLLEATQDDDEDEDMEDAKPNGVKAKGKGKAKAKITEEVEEDDEEEEDEEDDEDSDSDDGADLENFVVCTLDTERVSNTALSQPLMPPALTQPCRTTSKPLTSLSTMARRSSLLSLVPTLST